MPAIAMTSDDQPPPPPPPELPSTTTSTPSATATPPPKTTEETPPAPFDSRKPDSDNIVTIPSYSRWFAWDGIHECELRQLPEFFDGKSPSKNPRVYKYYRNSIINKYRANPSKKLTFTEVRRTLVGDVGPIRRVFDFLDTWGLINYTPSGKQPVRWESKSGATSAPEASAPADSGAGGEAVGGKSKKWCSGCKAACTIACFVCDKHDLVLCARCYVRGNYRVGVSSTEFRRVEISEQVKTDWTDKETLHLLEAVMQYGDDWKRVAEHVGGRTDKECVARFVKLPFGEQFVDPVDQNDEDSSYQMKGKPNGDSGCEPPAKKQHLTPLADASNPIMAQSAFLSALAGVEVSEAAARAAVANLYDKDHEAKRDSFQSQTHSLREQEPSAASNGDAALSARADAETLLKQEEDEFLNSISTIIEVKMKDIQDKLAQFEQTELQLEKERHQLQQMKHQFFLDQLSILLHKIKSSETVAQENVKKELTSSS